ncbi:hypothetical protein Tco_0145902 [Tanacetum coccineum]
MRNPVLLTLSRLRIKAKMAVMVEMEMVEMRMVEAIDLLLENAHYRSIESVNISYFKVKRKELSVGPLMCTKMVHEEEDRVEKFIRGLPDNIQGNVIAAEPTKLQDAVRIANNLMDQKLKGYVVKEC